MDGAVGNEACAVGQISEVAPAVPKRPPAGRAITLAALMAAQQRDMPIELAESERLRIQGIAPGENLHHQGVEDLDGWRFGQLAYSLAQLQQADGDGRCEPQQALDVCSVIQLA